MLGEGAPAADIAATRHAYELDLPLRVQYVHYWKGVLHGDLGRSIRLNKRVALSLAQAYPYTLRLTLGVAFVALILSIPEACARHSAATVGTNRLLSVVSLFGLSFPNFALAPILILLFPLNWDGSPSPRRGPPTSSARF